MAITHSDNETIAGIATAPGESGMSIIRISGEGAFSIVSRFFYPKHSPSLFKQSNRRLTYGWIEDQDLTLDEVLVCIMRGPHSFTAEDVVEVQCHGGRFITQSILSLAIKHGARLAQPGEFTRRAFLNGRIDLTQAEATNDLIHAKTDLGLSLVVNQLKGKLYDKILTLKEDLSWTLALINAGIDFPEEDIVFSDMEKIKSKLRHVESEVSSLVDSADVGIMMREGFKIVLAGAPNVGKSSILNGLLMQDRSIVTQIPGTTRDTIEESCSIQGIPISLTDTAGIHHTEDVIEKEGINRSLSAIQKADLVVWVIDASQPMNTIKLPAELVASNIPLLQVFNKKDRLKKAFKLPEPWKNSDYMLISAKDEDGINELRDTIYTYISGQKERLSEDTMLTNLRQKTAASNALAAIKQVLESIETGMGEEFLSVDLSEALNALSDIIGETTPDDMLDQIFANFCIGK